MRTLLLTLVALFSFAATPVYAATLSTSPTTISVTKGQTFTVAIGADPAGVKLYTVKSVLSYPATLLEATGFSFESSWIPLSMSGYDSVDNTGGVIIKTAGFPNGFTGVKTFGTITFKAKDMGTATISVGSASLAYDLQSKNMLSGTQGSTVVTVAHVSTQTPAPTPTTQTATSKPKPTQKLVSAGVAGAVSATNAASTTMATTTASSTDQGAAIITADVGGGAAAVPMWLWLLALITVILLGGGWWVYRFSKGR